MGLQSRIFRPSSGRELAPFGRGRGAVLLNILAAMNVAFEVEAIVHKRLDRNERLMTLHRPEPVHDLHSPS